VQKLADAVNHHDRILKEGDAFAVKLDGKQVGPACAFMQPFEELRFPSKSPNQRRTLTMLAKATGDLTDVVKRSRDTLERMLEDDGVLRTTFATPYEKKCFKGGLRSAHNYAEVGLEPDHRRDTAIWCELTYWAIDFLYTIENFRK